MDHALYGSRHVKRFLSPKVQKRLGQSWKYESYTFICESDSIGGDAKITNIKISKSNIVELTKWEQFNI